MASISAHLSVSLSSSLVGLCVYPYATSYRESIAGSEGERERGGRDLVVTRGILLKGFLVLDIMRIEAVVPASMHTQIPEGEGEGRVREGARESSIGGDGHTDPTFEA
jgi:hypothetical protein